MEISIFQKGFNYSQDGPGNRLVYHLQGCNMHCPWCSNPEGMSLKPPLMQIGKRLPDFICPHGAIQNGSINRSVCKDCTQRECVTSHRNRELVCQCQKMTVEQMVEEIQKSAPMFFDGGGVTLTGGEVTMQLDAVCVLLEQVHNAGIHTAIESNATHPALEKLFPWVDYLIVDFKQYDSGKLKQVTGAGNEEIVRNIHKAVRRNKPLLIRIPLINGFNASPEDINGFLSFFIELVKKEGRGQMAIEFLNYHEYGKDKWAQCGREYTMENAFVNQKTVQAFKAAFLAAGLPVINT